MSKLINCFHLLPTMISSYNSSIELMIIVNVPYEYDAFLFIYQDVPQQMWMVKASLPVQLGDTLVLENNKSGFLE